MKQLVLSFFLIFSILSSAQDPAVIELLKSQSQKFTEHDQVNVLNDLVDEILKPKPIIKNSENALPYANRALERADKLNYHYGISRSLNQLITINNILGNKTLAIKYRARLMTIPKGSVINQQQEEIAKQREELKNREKEIAKQQEELKRTEEELETKREEAEKIRKEIQELDKSNLENKRIAIEREEVLIQTEKQLVQKDSALGEVEGLVQVLVEEKKMLAMQNQLLQQESEIKELLVESQKLQNRFLWGVVVFVIILTLIMFIFYKTIRDSAHKLKEKNQIIEEEIKKSDELLLNILPLETANELKLTGKTQTRSYDMVTVIMTDFKDFTLIGQKLSAEKLVDEIDMCFSAFDAITTKYGIEKIKTIGDAYLCAQGLPTGAKHDATNAIKAAKEILEFMDSMKKKRDKEGRSFFTIRIGVHSGPLVAGVVGKKKFAYDIWGDTVNTAARMEQHGEPGRINISGATYELVKNDISCEYRGKILAKNKGEIDMYFVK